MSIFSKILESLGKNITKEIEKHTSKNASKEVGKNLAKPSVKGDIIPSKNPRTRGQMQDNIIKEFGTNYAEFKGKGQEAIKHLLEVKNGQVQGAFSKQIDGKPADIDLVWGKITNAQKKEGYGLAHIIDKHPDLDLNLIPKIIENGTIKKTHNGYNIATDKYIVGINKGWREKGVKKGDNLWIVTSFEAKNQGATKTAYLDSITGDRLSSPNLDKGIIPNKKPKNQTNELDSSNLIDNKLLPMMRE